MREGKGQQKKKKKMATSGKNPKKLRRQTKQIWIMVYLCTSRCNIWLVKIYLYLSSFLIFCPPFQILHPLPLPPLSLFLEPEERVADNEKEDNKTAG